MEADKTHQDDASFGWSLASGFNSGFNSILDAGAAWIARRSPLRLGDVSVSETVLGEGGYGRVLKGVDKTTGEEVAVKEIHAARMNPASIIKEVAILRRLGVHPNIISLRGYYEFAETGKHYIVMEAVTGGELFKQVETRGVLPEVDSHKYFSQIASGVLHMHSLGIAHRDLKLENTLLDFTEREVKIIDFGLAHAYQPRADGTGYEVTMLRHFCGSKSYCPPEMLASVAYNGFAADIYSLGVCLFALVTGFFPLEEACPRDWRFEKVARTQLAGRSTTRKIFEFYRRPCPLSDACVELLDGMLALDPRKRSSLKEVLAAEWMATAGQNDAVRSPAARGVGGGAPVDGGAWDKSLEVDMQSLCTLHRCGGASASVSSCDAQIDEKDGWLSAVPPEVPRLERQAARSHWSQGVD